MFISQLCFDERQLWIIEHQLQYGYSDASISVFNCMRKLIDVLSLHVCVIVS